MSIFSLRIVLETHSKDKSHRRVTYRSFASLRMTRLRVVVILSEAMDLYEGVISASQ